LADKGNRTGKDGKDQNTTDRKWWQTERHEKPPRMHQGQPCPRCLMGDLDYDALFRLRCPVCDYVAECGAFT